MGARPSIVELGPVEWERFSQSEDQLYWDGGSKAKTKLKLVGQEKEYYDVGKGKYHVPLYRLRAPLRIKWDSSLTKDCFGWWVVQMVFILFGCSWHKWCDDLRPHCGNLSVLN